MIPRSRWGAGENEVRLVPETLFPSIVSPTSSPIKKTNLRKGKMLTPYGKDLRTTQRRPSTSAFSCDHLPVIVEPSAHSRPSTSLEHLEIKKKLGVEEIYDQIQAIKARREAATRLDRMKTFLEEMDSFSTVRLGDSSSSIRRGSIYVDPWELAKGGIEEIVSSIGSKKGQTSELLGAVESWMSKKAEEDDLWIGVEDEETPMILEREKAEKGEAEDGNPISILSEISVKWQSRNEKFIALLENYRDGMHAMSEELSKLKDDKGIQKIISDLQEQTSKLRNDLDHTEMEYRLTRREMNETVATLKRQLDDSKHDAMLRMQDTRRLRAALNELREKHKKALMAKDEETQEALDREKIAISDKRVFATILQWMKKTNRSQRSRIRSLETALAKSDAENAKHERLLAGSKETNGKLMEELQAKGKEIEAIRSAYEREIRNSRELAQHNTMIQEKAVGQDRTIRRMKADLDRLGGLLLVEKRSHGTQTVSAGKVSRGIQASEITREEEVEQDDDDIEVEEEEVTEEVEETVVVDEGKEREKLRKELEQEMLWRERYGSSKRPPAVDVGIQCDDEMQIRLSVIQNRLVAWMGTVLRRQSHYHEDHSNIDLRILSLLETIASSSNPPTRKIMDGFIDGVNDRWSKTESYWRSLQVDLEHALEEVREGEKGLGVKDPHECDDDIHSVMDKIMRMFAREMEHELSTNSLQRRMTKMSEENAILKKEWKEMMDSIIHDVFHRLRHLSDDAVSLSPVAALISRLDLRVKDSMSTPSENEDKTDMQSFETSYLQDGRLIITEGDGLRVGGWIDKILSAEASHLDDVLKANQKLKAVIEEQQEDITRQKDSGDLPAIATTDLVEDFDSEGRKLVKVPLHEWESIRNEAAELRSRLRKYRRERAEDSDLAKVEEWSSEKDDDVKLAFSGNGGRATSRESESTIRGSSRGSDHISVASPRDDDRGLLEGEDEFLEEKLQDDDGNGEIVGKLDDDAEEIEDDDDDDGDDGKGKKHASVAPPLSKMIIRSIQKRKEAIELVKKTADMKRARAEKNMKIISKITKFKNMQKKLEELEPKDPVARAVARMQIYQKRSIEKLREEKEALQKDHRHVSFSAVQQLAEMVGRDAPAVIPIGSFVYPGENHAETAKSLKYLGVRAPKKPPPSISEIARQYLSPKTYTKIPSNLRPQRESRLTAISIHSRLKQMRAEAYRRSRAESQSLEVVARQFAPIYHSRSRLGPQGSERPDSTGSSLVSKWG